MDRQEQLSQIIKKLYDFNKETFSKKYSDSNFENVRMIANKMQRINGIKNITLNKQEEETFKDLDNDNVTVYKFFFNVITEYGKLSLLMTCCPNDQDFPSNDYNVVVSAWKQAYLSEAADNKSNLFQEFKSRLKNATSFEKVKKLILTFLGLGLGLSLMLVYVNSVFNLEERERQELAEQGLEVYYDDYGYKWTRDVEPEYIKPLWEEVEDMDWTVTVYNAEPRQCNRDCTTTASLFKIDKENPGSHKIVAMDRMSMKNFNFNYGDLIRIEGCGKFDGVYQIQDTMNKRYNGEGCIDILSNDNIRYGKWDNAIIYRLANQQDCYDDVKNMNDMKPAVNQDTINLRQAKQQGKN